MELFTQTLLDTPGPTNMTNPPPKDSLVFLDLDMKPNSSRFACSVCNKPTLSCCMECKSVFYCSLEHQQLHWNTHQYECRPSDDVGNVIPSRSVLRFDDNNSRKYSIIGRERAISRETNDENKKNIGRRTDTGKSEMEKSTRGEATEKEEVVHRREPRKESLQVGSEQSLSRKERLRKLREVLKCYMNMQYDQACLKARRLYEMAKELFEIDEIDIFEFIGDGLLLVKCFLTSGNIQSARENLVDLWKVAHEFVSDQKIEWKDENEKNSKLAFMHLNRGMITFKESETINFEKKQEINAKIQKITNLFSSFAVLFNAVGDFKNCEEAYVRYIKVVENNFGETSLESSNCYYLLGVFYLEQKYYVKSMACFKKALKNRQTKFNEDEMHESIADCYYNMAIIYKHTDKTLKAMKCLNTAFRVRTNLIGEFSLPVAQVLELVGKIITIQEDYRTAWAKFQECLAIRRRVLNDDTHPDVQRIKSLIQDLLQTINAKIHDDSITYGKREALFQLQKELEGKKTGPDYRIAFTEASRIKDPAYISKISFHAESNGLDEDDNRSPSKKANSRIHEPEFETVQKSDTALERSWSKTSGQHLKSLNFNRVQSNTRIEQDTEVYEHPDKYFDVANSIKTINERSPAESNKRATLGIPTEGELLTHQFLRPDIFRLQSSPIVTPKNVSPSAKKSVGGRKPTKSVTTMDRGFRASFLDNGVRRSSDNTTEKKNKKLNLPEKFVDELTNGQILLLSQLNSIIKENQNEKLDVLTKQSDFLKSLTNDQRDEFMALNADLDLN